MNYGLFDWAAERYDLHTPPHHYQHDHRFVLEELLDVPAGGRVLDVGCGTGGFLELLQRETEMEAFGIDASEAMVRIARRKIGKARVEVVRMQNLKEKESYDALISLSWSFNYCVSFAEARAVLARFAAALTPGGKIILQVAHAPNATGCLLEDCEIGPNGLADDILFLYRFNCIGGENMTLQADYVYASRSLNELLHETHQLNAADALRVAELAGEVGFEEIQIYDSWQKKRLTGGLSPFIVARRRA